MTRKSPGALLNAKRKRTPKRCAGCGEVVTMLGYQTACSDRCRQRIRRGRTVD